MTITFNTPVSKLCSTEHLVIGSGLWGVVTAYALAKQGKKVLLIESGTHLSPDLCDTLRPWVRYEAKYKAVLQNWFDIREEYKEGTIVPFSMDQYKRFLEDKLIQAGVDLLYGLRLIEVQREGQSKDSEKSQTVIVGSRSGVYAITAKSIYKKEVEKEKEEDKVCLAVPTYLCLEFENVTASPSELNQSLRHLLQDQQIELWFYPTVMDNRIVEIRWLSELKEEKERSYFELYEKAIAVAKFLLTEVKAFENARFGVFAHKVLDGRVLDECSVIDQKESDSDGRSSVDQKASAFDPVQTILEAEGNLIEAYKISNEVSIHQSKVNRLDSAKSSLDSVKNSSESDSESEDKQFLYAYNEFQSYYQAPVIENLRLKVDEVRKCQVLVIGGGTGGAVAAIEAARNGADTVLLEMNPLVGGTGTLGGVHIHWFSRREGYVKEIDDAFEALGKAVRFPFKTCCWNDRDTWNPYLKSYILWQEGLKNHVEYRLDCVCVAVVKDGNKVKGALALQNNKLSLILSEVSIDATGDGDAAVLAGAEYTYGNERDRMPMWSCMGQFKQAGVYKGGIFTTAVDVGDPFDYTRYILVNRRRGPEELHDHSSYICTRESRHIHGEACVDLRAICSYQQYPDTVASCFSNLDTKGKSLADMVYFGYLPPQHDVYIPLGAYIPKGLDGLYVVGKAISATHDAMPMLRMQGDVQNQGGILGLAAALCVKDKTSVRKVDVQALQARLLELGILKAMDGMDSERFCNIGKASVLEDSAANGSSVDCAEMIRQISDDEPFNYSDLDKRSKVETQDRISSLLLAESEAVLPHLRQEYEQSSGQRRLTLARLLLWHRDESGLSTLLEEIHRNLNSAETLIDRQGSIDCCIAPPDHGTMCEVTYLINLLSRSNDKKILEVFEPLLERIEASERKYLDVRQFIFNHIESIAYVAERICWPEFVPILKRALQLPEFAQSIVIEPYAYDIDIKKERISYLRQILLRALARCKDKDGYWGLTEHLKDQRKILAKSAADELASLTGEKFGLDTIKWRAYLQGRKFTEKPVQDIYW